MCLWSVIPLHLPASLNLPVSYVTLSGYISFCRVYLSVGRMFVLTNVTDMRNDLKAKQEKCDKAIDLLSKKKEFLVKSLKDQEDGLRELVQQRKEAEAAK